MESMTAREGNALRRAIGIAIAGTSLALGACSMPNSSTPTLSINEATVHERSADLALEIKNPSDYDLTVETIDWTLSHGPLPVASGEWPVNQKVPSRSDLVLRKRIPFESAPVDPSAREVELAGQMKLSGKIKTAGFVASATERR